MNSFDSSVVFIRSTDLDRSASFYSSLGLPLVLDQGTCRIFRVSDSAFLGVCEGEPVTDGVIITLVSSEVEAVCQGLTDRGVQFEKDVAYNPTYDITHAFLRDPDGYLVEIQRFESPEWPNGSDDERG